MTSDNTCIIGCFQLKNENTMCEHPAYQLHVSRIGFCVCRIIANLLGHPVVNIIKGLKFNWCASHYAELLQVSLKEDLVNNGCSLFAKEIILKPQYAEDFIKSFQFSLVEHFTAFECHKRRRVFVRNKRAVG